MPIVVNQINLQTSFSKLAVVYYLLKVVADNQPVTRSDSRDRLFPIARSKLKSTTEPWSPSKKDTHARISLEEYGLIEYDESDPEKFSVSSLGNELLGAYEMTLIPEDGGLITPQLIPRLDEDEILFLLWRVVCSTFKIDDLYSIHPYRMLMILLSRQKLQGYMTKREWARFLVDPSCRRDIDIDVIETMLLEFRNSGEDQDIKSTDRVLGRLTDWGILEAVPGTSGNQMAYKIKESFKWVVISNLSIKELDMNWSDTILIKNLFIRWAQLQPSYRGDGNITLEGAKHYAYELENDLNDPSFVRITVGNLFSIVDHSKYIAIKQDILATEGFGTYDTSRGNGYFSRALNMYEKFLGDVLVQSQLSRIVRDCIPYLSAIRTKPFILLAGISGTGKSRMVRQLARGCCPAESPLAKDNDGKEAKKPGNFAMIPVRPNWHDSTELMGYVTRITSDKQPKFVLTPFVKFLVKAWQNLDVPFFLCLDEMNLAPVEQYFAEYLSAIESRDWVDADDHSKGKTTDVMVHFDVAQIKKDELHPYDDETKNFVIVADGGLRIPPNLVVMGTVNMDETTCSFSRKVLDRAMTFELNDVSDMYDISNIAGEGPYDFGSIAPEAIWQTLLSGKDACDSAEGKAEIDAATHKTVAQVVLEYIKTINDVLENTPFKIAYRSRNEILIYCLERTRGAIVGLPQALDEATSMKILSRIEGDEQKLTYLEGNGAEPSKTLLDVLAKKIPEALKTANGGHDPTPPCEVCGKKIEFMARRLKGGFTNFFV